MPQGVEHVYGDGQLFNRFNRRTSRHRGKLFYRLLEQAVAVDPVPYATMVKGLRGPRRRRHPNRS